MRGAGHKHHGRLYRLCVSVSIRSRILVMQDTPLLEKSGMRKGRSLDGQVKKGKVLKLSLVISGHTLPD